MTMPSPPAANWARHWPYNIFSKPSVNGFVLPNYLLIKSYPFSNYRVFPLYRLPRSLGSRCLYAKRPTSKSRAFRLSKKPLRAF
mgnify:CR=1 FL=1